MPDADLRLAFLNTTYGTADGRFRLTDRPGLPSPVLPAGSWAILTAFNPNARPQDAASNEAAQGELRLALAGFEWQPGINGEGPWTEPSLIVAGLPLGPALALGRQFGQVALLWGCGRRAALVWCAPEQPKTVERFWVLAEANTRDQAQTSPRR